jgi:hypothetical protein
MLYSNKKTIKVENAHSHKINCIFIDDNDRFIFSGDIEGVLKIWNFNDL